MPAVVFRSLLLRLRSNGMGAKTENELGISVVRTCTQEEGRFLNLKVASISLAVCRARKRVLAAPKGEIEGHDTSSEVAITASKLMLSTTSSLAASGVSAHSLCLNEMSGPYLDWD